MWVPTDGIHVTSPNGAREEDTHNRRKDKCNIDSTFNAEELSFEGAAHRDSSVFVSDAHEATTAKDETQAAESKRSSKSSDEGVHVGADNSQTVK